MCRIHYQLRQEKGGRKSRKDTHENKLYQDSGLSLPNPFHHRIPGEIVQLHPPLLLSQISSLILPHLRRMRHIIPIAIQQRLEFFVVLLDCRKTALGVMI